MIVLHFSSVDASFGNVNNTGGQEGSPPSLGIYVPPAKKEARKSSPTPKRKKL